MGETVLVSDLASHSSHCLSIFSLCRQVFERVLSASKTPGLLSHFDSNSLESAWQKRHFLRGRRGRIPEVISCDRAEMRGGRRDGEREGDRRERAHPDASVDRLLGMVFKYREEISDLKLRKSPRRSLDGGVERDIFDG